MPDDDPCAELRAEIQDLQIEVADLNETLKSAESWEKPNLLKQIDHLNAQIAKDKDKLAICEKGPPPVERAWPVECLFGVRLKGAVRRFEARRSLHLKFDGKFQIFEVRIEGDQEEPIKVDNDVTVRIRFAPNGPGTVTPPGHPEQQGVRAMHMRLQVFTTVEAYGQSKNLDALVDFDTAFVVDFPDGTSAGGSALNGIGHLAMVGSIKDPAEDFEGAASLQGKVDPPNPPWSL